MAGQAAHATPAARYVIILLPPTCTRNGHPGMNDRRVDPQVVVDMEIPGLASALRVAGQTKEPMRSSTYRLPFGLGLLVRRRTDPAGAVGYVVGVVLRPSRLVLVRWRGAASTFETLDSLVEAHGIVL